MIDADNFIAIADVGVDRYEKYLIDSAILEHGGRVFQMIPPPDTPDSRLVISSSNKFKRES